jgi:hypothetical protein
MNPPPPPPPKMPKNPEDPNAEMLARYLAESARRGAAEAVARYRRWVVTSWIVSAVAVTLVVIDLATTVTDNTAANRRQDCVLVGLLNVFTKRDPLDRDAFGAGLRLLDPGTRCPALPLQR